MLYSFFWVIPRRRNFMCQRFETLCLFHLHRSVNKKLFFLFTRPKTMEKTDCSETSAHKIQTPGNHPKERIQQNLTKHPVKSGLPADTKGTIKAHHRATFPVLHQCVYVYGCIDCALCWSKLIFVHVSRLQDKITIYILPIYLPKTLLRLHILNITNTSKLYSRKS
jgi:hypothetical protein